jgi:hypothetical protein
LVQVGREASAESGRPAVAVFPLAVEGGQGLRVRGGLGGVRFAFGLEQVSAGSGLSDHLFLVSTDVAGRLAAGPEVDLNTLVAGCCGPEWSARSATRVLFSGQSFSMRGRVVSRAAV